MGKEKEKKEWGRGKTYIERREKKFLIKSTVVCEIIMRNKYRSDTGWRDAFFFLFFSNLFSSFSVFFYSILFLSLFLSLFFYLTRIFTSTIERCNVLCNSYRIVRSYRSRSFESREGKGEEERERESVRRGSGGGKNEETENVRERKKQNENV